MLWLALMFFAFISIYRFGSALSEPIDVVDLHTCRRWRYRSPGMAGADAGTFSGQQIHSPFHVRYLNAVFTQQPDAETDGCDHAQGTYA